MTSTKKTGPAAAPVVVKIGGALVAGNLDSFWHDVGQLTRSMPVIIVHGGGPEATRVARLLGHEPRIIHGRRVTTDRDLEILEWVARGSINTRLVGQALAHGVTACGLSGVDGGLILVKRRPPWNIDGETVDFGFVGDVVDVRPHLLRTLVSHGVTPIVGPLGVDNEGQAYNVNADTIARVIAEAVGAQLLVLVTEAGGLRSDASARGDIIAACNRDTYEAGVREGWISGGMRVKLQVAFEALEAGVSEVWIAAPDDLLSRASATRVIE